MRCMLVIICTSSVALSACGGWNPFGQRHDDAKKAVNQHVPQNGDKDKTAACAAASVRRVTRPQNPDATGGVTFDYAYEYVAPSADGAPTVVYIPGGPGQAAIGESDDWKAKL